MFVVSYTNISPSFILILNKILETQEKIYFLIYSNVHDDVTNLKFGNSWQRQKSDFNKNNMHFFPLVKVIHQLHLKSHIIAKQIPF